MPLEKKNIYINAYIWAIKYVYEWTTTNMRIQGGNTYYFFYSYRYASKVNFKLISFYLGSKYPYPTYLRNNGTLNL